MTLADDLAVPGLRITQMSHPLSGVVSFWLDTALNRRPIEAVLAGVTARLAGYLALESVPVVNTTQARPLGERLPGLYNVAFLEKPDFLTSTSGCSAGRDSTRPWPSKHRAPSSTSRTSWCGP